MGKFDKPLVCFPQYLSPHCPFSVKQTPIVQTRVSTQSAFVSTSTSPTYN